MTHWLLGSKCKELSAQQKIIGFTIWFSLGGLTAFAIKYIMMVIFK